MSEWPTGTEAIASPGTAEAQPAPSQEAPTADGMFPLPPAKAQAYADTNGLPTDGMQEGGNA
jgi:hypothetical protein